MSMKFQRKFNEISMKSKDVLRKSQDFLRKSTESLRKSCDFSFHDGFPKKIVRFLKKIRGFHQENHPISEETRWIS